MRTTETIVTKAGCGIYITFRMMKRGARWYIEMLLPNARLLVGVTKTKEQAYDIIEGIMTPEPDID